uniref:ISC 1043-like protein n=1 Tax=Saccharolobus solfataricus (strain 98/2) TaxID=555311 RepID=G8GCU2_SACS9|nr:ISC 1043-like protein [Saccharolobus solfataricus 98/2]
MYHEHMNKKLTQKDFDNFKESIEDLIKLYKESRLSKIENNKENEEERSARLRRFGRELRLRGGKVRQDQERTREKKQTNPTREGIHTDNQGISRLIQQGNRRTSITTEPNEEGDKPQDSRETILPPHIFVILYNLLSKTVGGLKVVMDGTGYSLVVTKH